MGNTEPVLTGNGIVAFVSAVLVLAISFGLDISEDQKTAILAVVAIVAPLLAAWWIRRRVTPLTDPKDVDGKSLLRPDGQISLVQQRMIEP